MTWLERYRDLVDDFSAFADASRAPLPLVVWTHPSRISCDRLRARFRARELPSRALSWLPDAFRLQGTDHPGLTFEVRAGLCHVQEEVSLVPPELLTPLPGDRVLDTCCAPGGKTARLALAMNGLGTVVANDRDGRRLRALSSHVERLGLTNVCATRVNAATLPRRFGSFDRILCDVPCSGEGTSRKNGNILSRPIENRDSLARLQSAILERAVRALRPGGRLVYSTCTYAPEENEAVIDAVLRAADGDLRIVPVTGLDLPHAPGVTDWDGRSFDSSLRHACRFWPHVADTGGFFAAVLEKSVDSPAPPEITPELSVRQTDAALRGEIDRFSERFGLPEDALAGLAFRHASKKRVSMEAVGLDAPPDDVVEFHGVMMAHAGSKQLMPTTSAARAFGPVATRNVVSLTAAELDPYLARGSQPVSIAAADPSPRGSVLVTHDGYGVGTGILRPQEDATILESSFPKPPPGQSPGSGVVRRAK